MIVVLPDVASLKLVDVLERGIPNKERIVIQVKERTEMAAFGLFVAWKPAGFPMQAGALLMNDTFLWFGSGTVEPGSVIFVYTGAGEPRLTTVEGTDQIAYVIHWGKTKTLFANTNTAPCLVRFGELTIGPSVADQPQFALLKK